MTEIKAPEGGRPVSEMQLRVAQALVAEDPIVMSTLMGHELAALALAAMKAMREPTEAMVDAGYCLSDYPFATWQHMIIREISIAEWGKND